MCTMQSTMLLSGKMALAGVRAQKAARPATAKPVLARRQLAGIVRAEKVQCCGKMSDYDKLLCGLVLHRHSKLGF